MRAWIFAALFLSSTALAETDSEDSSSEGAPSEVVSTDADPTSETSTSRRPLPPLSEDGLTEASDEDGAAVSTGSAPSSSGAESGETYAESESASTGPSYAEGVGGKIEDGRRFVWAAYGVSWAVLILFTLSVIRRWQAQANAEQSS